MPDARLHDGSTIKVEVQGHGPTVLLAVNPRPIEGEQAQEMQRWGADPALGRRLIDGLSEAFRVVAFDYEGHVLQVPKPDTLTPDNLTADLLAVADAVNAERFAYYGYSWLALSGLQLAIRTDRLAGLAMGGFPPLGGPYGPMLRVTTVTHEMALANQASGHSGTGARASEPPEDSTPAQEPVQQLADEPAQQPGDEPDWSQVEMTLAPVQTRQFVTLYEALQDFDDLAAQARITCPRLCFVGSADEITYDERWGGVHVSIGGPVVQRRAELEALGWQVRVLDGLDHMRAMQAEQVLPILRPWLVDSLGG